MTTPNEQAGTDACLCYCHKLSHFAGQCTECRQYGLHQPIKEASPSSVTDAWERFHANTTPHSELAPQTTPSKADIRTAIAKALKEAFGMTYIDPNSRPMAVLEMLITTTLTQHNEALLAKLPEKHKFTDKPRNTIHAMANEAEVNGFNAAIDQVTAVIKGSTHD